MLMIGNAPLFDGRRKAHDLLESTAYGTRRMLRDDVLHGRKVVLQDDISKGSERFPVRVVNDVDGAKMVDFVYTTRILDKNGVLAARRNAIVMFCCCRGVCSTDCECSSGNYDAYGYVHESLLEWPFMECNAACTCSLQCGNRVAQKGATYAIELKVICAKLTFFGNAGPSHMIGVANTSAHRIVDRVFRTCDGRGWAVRALRDIQRGSFIGEYTGELISDTEMARSDRTDTYFFETRVGEKLYTVDARRYGNFTRFINHSCRPNARVGMVIWEAQPEQLCHICIFASENISKGEEITISYGKSWWEAKLTQFSCRCGNESCEYTEDHRKSKLHRLALEMLMSTKSVLTSNISA